MNFFALPNNGCWLSSCFYTFQTIFPYEFKFGFRGFSYRFDSHLNCLDDPFGNEQRTVNSPKNTHYASLVLFFWLRIHVYTTALLNISLLLHTVNLPQIIYCAYHLRDAGSVFHIPCIKYYVFVSQL